MFPTLEDIAKRRRQLGLKQSELAKAAGVSQSLIAKLEAGTIDSSYTKVKTIFDVLERLEFKTKIQAEKILHNDVLSIQKDQPISEVVKIMKDHGYSQLPVFNRKTICRKHFRKSNSSPNSFRKRLRANLQTTNRRHYGRSVPTDKRRCTLVVDYKSFADLLSCFSIKKRRRGWHNYEGRLAANALNLI